MAQLKWLSSLLLGAVLLAPQTLAQTSKTEAATTPAAAAPAEKQVITELKDIAGTNSIPLLGNRFRIDFAVDEVTLVFFRKKGAPSVVLVRPDGSKVYARTAKDNGMQWFDDKTYDLIKMTKPTPGPWQAIGEILPESRIMVLTEIGLDVDALPTDLMVGEIFKVTARLSNGGKPVNVKDFRDILQLDVLLFSTQKPGYDNSNATVLNFTSFADDGKNYDERPRDAIFTGEFNLKIPAGEWLPKYLVKTPLYTRELMQDPVLVIRTPIKTEAVESLTPDEPHQVTYQVTEGPINADSLIVQGRLRYPNGEVQSFSLGEQQGDKRVLRVANAGVGTYRIEQMLFGKTKTGREFVISLPEYTFAAIGPKIAVPEVPAAETAKPADAAAPNPAGTSIVAAEAETPAEPPAEFPLGLVIGVNLLILIGGGGAILLTMNANAQRTVSMLLAKLNPAALLKRKKAGAGEMTLPGMEQSSAADSPAAVKKPPKNKASDDILDLSLPDD
ncbi:TIGR03503 family protein [Rheinheimera sp. F8]|uniref:TIGR03503 family protein n=1 Tax=Rheinheimera sp. F8 TaxID=1763998 RepID=UPI0007449404|nr:TIGR03503 family protein [Rheinheimera sp. F8]ALZ74606.1 hypothetical protein ATY27_01755 [Rheinheimera sp. F8]